MSHLNDLYTDRLDLRRLVIHANERQAFEDEISGSRVWLKKLMSGSFLAASLMQWAKWRIMSLKVNEMSAVWLVLSWRISQHSSCLSLCLNNIHNTLDLNLSWLMVLNLSRRSIILQISFNVPHPPSPNCLYFLVYVFTLKWRLDIDSFPLWHLLGVTFVSLL